MKPVHLLVPIFGVMNHPDWFAFPKIAYGPHFDDDIQCSTVVEHVTCKKCFKTDRYRTAKAVQK